MSDKKVIDWERIDLDYRAGLLTLREIVSRHGGSPAGILKRAKRDGWVRDLGEKIKARAEEIVNKSEVNKKVNKETAVSEREVIEAGAEAVAQVKLSHRSSIARYRTLTTSLLSELEAQTGDPDLFQHLAELMADPDDKGNDRLAEMYQRVIALPSRIDSTKKLAETLKALISLERDAFDIAPPVKIEHTGKGGGPIQHEQVELTLEEMLEEAKRRGLPIPMFADE